MLMLLTALGGKILQMRKKKIVKKGGSYPPSCTCDLTLRKWCYSRLQHDFPLDPIISPFDFHFQTFVTCLRENYDYCNVSWEMICICMILPCPK